MTGIDGTGEAAPADAGVIRQGASAVIENPGAQHVVLDTNVVLDWLVFGDARCAALARHLETEGLIWHATVAMRAELASVLSRPSLSRWNPQSEQVLALFDRHVRLTPEPTTHRSDAVPACADPDDQKFIDLALHTQARWLFSRDRALLDLARQARRHGIEVLSPAEWNRGLVGR